jgi:hypothetical protein
MPVGWQHSAGYFFDAAFAHKVPTPHTQPVDSAAETRSIRQVNSFVLSLAYTVC